MSSCTIIILIAVHLCPLKLKLPKTHSDPSQANHYTSVPLTALSMSALGRMIAGFFASRPRQTLSLCGLGWAFWSLSAASLVPMNAKIDSWGCDIIGGNVFLPEPLMMLITPNQ